MMQGTTSEGWEKVEKPTVGKLYHVLWGSNGMVGRCMSINWEEETVVLRSPKTKKVWKNPIKFSDLRHTRRNAQKEKAKNY